MIVEKVTDTSGKSEESPLPKAKITLLFIAVFCLMQKWEVIITRGKSDNWILPGAIVTFASAIVNVTFASAIVKMVYTLSGLWQKEHPPRP